MEKKLVFALFLAVFTAMAMIMLSDTLNSLLPSDSQVLNVYSSLAPAGDYSIIIRQASFDPCSSTLTVGVQLFSTGYGRGDVRYDIAGSSFVVSVPSGYQESQLQLSLSQGRYSVKAVADPFNSVRESDENNNSDEKQFDVESCNIIQESR